MRIDSTDCRKHVASASFGVLGTLDSDRGTHLVPVVFAVRGDELVIPVDGVKPKRTKRLRRIDNLRANARASLLVDHTVNHTSPRERLEFSNNGPRVGSGTGRSSRTLKVGPAPGFYAGKAFQRTGSRRHGGLFSCRSLELTCLRHTATSLISDSALIGPRCSAFHPLRAIRHDRVRATIR